MQTVSAKEPQQTQPPQERSDEALANLGEPVTLNQLGEVRVRELSLENVLRFSRELFSLFNLLPEGTDNKEFLLALLSNPEAVKLLREILGAAINKNADDLKEMSLTDWLKLLAAFKRVMNWEELKKSFFELIPREHLPESLQTL